MYVVSTATDKFAFVNVSILSAPFAASSITGDSASMNSPLGVTFVLRAGRRNPCNIS